MGQATKKAAGCYGGENVLLNDAEYTRTNKKRSKIQADNECTQHANNSKQPEEVLPRLTMRGVAALRVATNWTEAPPAKKSTRKYKMK